MVEIVELNSNIHAELKLSEQCPLEFASGQRVLHVRAAEIGKAVSSFPVFLTRSSGTGGWVLSAITGLLPGHSVFVEHDRWQGLYEPTAMRVYPFSLVQSEHDHEQFSVGYDPQCGSLSTEHGTALFDDKGEASMFMKSITSILKADLKHDVQSALFAQHLDKLGLTKEININVQFEDQRTQTIAGLHTIDEEAMQSLSANELLELNQKGYLMLVNAMLVSIFQLNSLIKRHNRLHEDSLVRQIKLETPKD